MMAFQKRLLLIVPNALYLAIDTGNFAVLLILDFTVAVDNAELLNLNDIKRVYSTWSFECGVRSFIQVVIRTVHQLVLVPII